MFDKLKARTTVLGLTGHVGRSPKRHADLVSIDSVSSDQVAPGGRLCCTVSMRARGIVGAMLVAGTVLAGCSGQGGTAVAQDWTGSPVYATLRSVPANNDTKFEIGLVNPARLNNLDRSAPSPLPTTALASGLRPESETAWSRYAIATPACEQTEMRTFARGFHTGPAGDMLTINAAGYSADAAIGVCAGEIDLSVLRGKPATFDNIAGYQLGSVWAGRSGGLMYQIGSKVPTAVRTAVLTRAAGTASLAEDPDVAAVLAANPQAAAIEMGTVFLATPPGHETGSPLPKIRAAVEASQGKQLPAQTFGGYAWTWTGGFAGTATFVTRYRNDTDAATAASVLTAIWPQAGQTQFTGASTTTEGATVITRVPDTDPTTFNLLNLRVLSYPGFGSKPGG